MNASEGSSHRPAPMADSAPLTVLQFCERYGISRHTYYRMRSRGETPPETVISPRRRVILAASLTEWERRRMEVSGAQG